MNNSGLEIIPNFICHHVTTSSCAKPVSLHHVVGKCGIGYKAHNKIEYCTFRVEASKILDFLQTSREIEANPSKC
ncbi:hypothetical protein Lal_00035486 [Lupinus albus]|nr:hypothetical protein Lal_00035486 [Lupinus albus]